jgi:hypothetical protein
MVYVGEKILVIPCCLNLQRVELTLQEYEAPSSALSFCTTTHGIYKWEEVTEFNGTTHTYFGDPIELTKDMMNTGEGSIINEVFYFSEYGGGYGLSAQFTPV